MAFPGIISRLHPVSDPAQLQQQLTQGAQYRAEAFWLPALMPSHVSELLAALPESCSLFLEQESQNLSLRSHDGTLHNNEELITVNGQSIALATTPGDGGLVAESGMCEMTDWLEAGHRHFICSAAVQPVARAILNIWPLDPYLARHYLMTFTPLLKSATEAEYLEVFTARAHPANPHSDWVQAYMKLEKKLHRAYLDH
ncbi:hypothetical protein I6L35_00570 [Aeromonas sp. FDAARGOS 1405]|uniref:hypothetical protein n=1 Tax=Aeromonas TaxID=642 RepID=UPI001C247D05|nr:hypothetical protein [Aeromonas sp. FDAARGOS 1405]QXB29745.1 hypothetical protein I6L35_00570 [Aeromonas sp. FDAARGOS 1405]